MKITSNYAQIYMYPSVKPLPQASKIAQQKPNSNALFNNLNALALNNRSLAFKGSVNGAYDEFIKVARGAGLKTRQDYIDEMKPENLVGSGANSNVYKFSDPRLDKWLIKSFKNNSLHFFPCDDFDGENMGQQIAYAQTDFAIINKVEGEAHSTENWCKYATNKSFYPTHEEAEKFYSDIKRIASFPQKSFDDYAKKLKLLSDKGYKMDSINPNNLLIDYDNKEINIIDFGNKRQNNRENTVYDLFMPILDFSMHSGYLVELGPKGRDLRKSGKVIIEKCIKAAKNNNIPLSSDSYLEWLNSLDKNYKLKGQDSHYYRYDTICRIYPETEHIE